MQQVIASPSVLFVEDDPIAREIIAAHLRRAGIDVVEASTGATALALAERQSFDLVVLDVNLPDRVGFGLAARLQHGRDVAII